MSKLMLNGYCFVCGGNGFFDKDCPSCGKQAIKKSMNLDQKEDVDEFVKKVEVTGIPRSYAGVIWDSGILRETKPNLKKDLSFDKFVKQLEKINGTFAGSFLPGKSVIIIAPAGFSKMVFAYSCMQRALDHGFTVAPLLDTVEIKRILTLAGDNPSYRGCNSINYDDYIMADVLFATVTKLPSHEWAYSVIQELIDRRARKGLSTIILSRYSLSEISRKDFTNQFSSIATSVSNDGMKYPAIVKYVPNR